MIANLTIEEKLIETLSFLDKSGFKLSFLSANETTYKQLYKELGCLVDERFDSTGKYINIAGPTSFIKVYQDDTKRS